MSEPTYTEYLQLRKSDDPPPPSPHEDETLFYAAADGTLRSMQSDGTDAPVGGGGGGSQTVFAATVPISSAEILALADTPVVLVPGVADKVTVVTGVCVTYLAGETPYTLDPGNPGTIEVITLQPAWSDWEWTSALGANGFIDQAESQVAPCDVTVDAPGPLSDYTNLPVSLHLHNAGANPTLGDGTLEVTVQYFLAPVG